MQFSVSCHDRLLLTEKVMAYKATGKGWESIQEAIFLLIYEYNPKWIKWDEDTRSDFLLYFYPRIKPMVEKYTPSFHFETYLLSAIRWSVIRFRERENYRQYKISWVIRELERQSAELENEQNADQKVNKLDLPFPMDGEGRIADLTTRKRLICAIMLVAANLKAKVIPQIAYIIGVKSDWLYVKMAQVRFMIEEKSRKHAKLEERINECWFKMNSAREMAGKASTEVRRNMWDKRFRTWSKRYLVASDTIKTIRLKPSHSEIGKILNLPTGTVSSSLYHLREILKKP